jgi:hypothetical protein
MSDVFSDTYWQNEFGVTTADLDRLARCITEAGQAQDLMTLIRRIVRGRLHHGADDSAAAPAQEIVDTTVRLWDPFAAWQAGDRVIVARYIDVETYEPCLSLVVAVRSEEKDVAVYLDCERRTTHYELAAANPAKAKAWRDKVRDVVEAQRRAPEAEARADSIILTFGDRIATLLLAALQADRRFIELYSRWFLRALAAPPSEEQMTALAWAVLRLDAPQSTGSLAALLSPPSAPGDAALFGLYAALLDRPHIFCASPAPDPLWSLAGPPPGGFTPRCAAYDPETYRVLCLPGQHADAGAVSGLWRHGLLRAVAT